MRLLESRDYYKPFSYPWCFEAYKQQKQMEWLPEEVSFSGDKKDWDLKLNKEEKYLLTQIFRFFTQADCFHPDTDILTEKGWINSAELLDNVGHMPTQRNPKRLPKVAQYDSEGIITFAQPLDVIKRDYDGDLYYIKDGKARTEQLVTDKHKIVYWYKEQMRTSLAVDFLPYQGVKLKATGYKEGDITSLTPLERLQIAFQADGHVAKDVDGSKLDYIPHYFSFKKDRKIERLTWILEECEIEYKFVDKERTDYTTFYIKYPVRSKMSKTFDWVDLSNISTKYAKAFLQELSYWDSHIDINNHVVYSNTNKAAVDMVQVLAVLADVSHSYGVRVDNRSSKFSDVYVLGYNQEAEDIDGQSLRRNSTKIPYKGKVYCLTMPQGTLITRYNNHVAFTGNCDVAVGYYEKFLPIFRHPEIRMMMGAFASMEGTHIHAYSTLLDTVGMPEIEYQAFHEYKQMQEKHKYLEKFKPERYFNKYDISNLSQTEFDANYVELVSELSKALAVYAAFTEGLQLFSSFAILLNFTRYGKMKGMGQIVTWSIRDETLHVNSMIKLFNTLIHENPWLWTDSFKKELYQICRDMVKLEDRFIHLAFKQKGVEGLTEEEVKQYVRWIANRRLLQLGLKTNYKVKENPLPWLDEMLNTVEHTNFFENRVTEYTKASSTGSWDEVWGKGKRGLV